MGSNYNVLTWLFLWILLLAKPIPVKNVDGTMNQQGAVRYTTIQTIRIKSPSNEYHEERSELYVTALGDHDVIFGTDWLQAHNPEVDWAKPQLAFTRCPKSCIRKTRSCFIITFCAFYAWFNLNWKNARNIAYFCFVYIPFKVILSK